MKKFLVMYCMHQADMQEWMKKPESERKEAEQKMMADWQEWSKNNPQVVDTRAAGKTKKVTAEGIMDFKNDLMLTASVEAETPDAAAEMFKAHPHLGIPGAWIEVMDNPTMGANQA